MDNLIYVVMAEDRHVDVDIELFVNKERALKRAKEIFNESKYLDWEDDEDIGENKLDPDVIREGWIYSAIYSTEGDSVSVRERKLDKDL